jgi:hypothetical protein
VSVDPLRAYVKVNSCCDSFSVGTLTVCLVDCSHPSQARCMQAHHDWLLASSLRPGPAHANQAQQLQDFCAYELVQAPQPWLRKLRIIFILNFCHIS